MRRVFLAARTRGGSYVDVYVHVHEANFTWDEWIPTGRSYRLHDGTRRWHQFNARSESLATKPTYRGPWARGQRCLIPAESRRLIADQPRPVPLSEKEQQRQAAEQAKAKSLRDQQAQQLRVDQQKMGGSDAVDAAARKERAWNQHYKKPAKCDGNPNNETMTECANDYIRSKQQFDRAYKARPGQSNR